MNEPAADPVNSLSNDFIEEVGTLLSENRLVRKKLPNWGLIHIDRQLPFLCIYRRPRDGSDRGTDSLLLGQPSYLLIEQQLAGSVAGEKLIATILQRLSGQFGRVLVFEIWSQPQSVTAGSSSARVRFSIKAPRQHAPHAMLEELETTLLDTRDAEVALSYGRQCHPPGMTSLLSEERLAELAAVPVGLGLTPVYRQSANHEPLPYRLRELHHGLTPALRRSFYQFSRRYTTLRPTHYHELGRRAMTEAVWQTDRQLAAIKDQFDILYHVTPVNTDDAWQEFQDSGFSQTPEFNYRPRPIDPDLLKRQLYGIPLERIEDPTLSYIFRSQRDEIDRLLTMIGDRNTSCFLFGSMQVFGTVDPWLRSLAGKLLDSNATADQPPAGETYSAKAFAQQAEQLLQTYRQQMPELSATVQIRDDLPGIMVSRGHLMIGRNSHFPKDTAAAVLAHEVGTHILTYYNGKAQPFHQFHSGMANYEALQEGLAVVAEYLVGALKPRRLRSLAARVVAVEAMIDGAGFIDVFQLLTRQFGFAAATAFNITMRVFRGGGFTKDIVYLRGLSELLDYLGKGGDLEILYAGKLAQESLPFIQELRWRQVLNDSPLTPHYLHSPQAEARLKRLRQGISITQLIRGKGL